MDAAIAAWSRAQLSTFFSRMSIKWGGHVPASGFKTTVTCARYFKKQTQSAGEFIEYATGQNWGCDHVWTDQDMARRKRLGPPRIKHGTFRRVNELIQILGLRTKETK